MMELGEPAETRGLTEKGTTDARHLESSVPTLSGRNSSNEFPSLMNEEFARLDRQQSV